MIRRTINKIEETDIAKFIITKTGSIELDDDRFIPKSKKRNKIQTKW